MAQLHIPQITNIPRKVRTCLSQHQKFRKAQIVSQELASLASEVGMVEFEEKLSILRELRDIWAAGGKATIQQDGYRKEKG